MSNLSRKLDRAANRSPSLRRQTGRFVRPTHIPCPHCGAQLELSALYVIQILTPGPAATAQVVKQGVLCNRSGCLQPILSEPDGIEDLALTEA